MANKVDIRDGFYAPTRAEWLALRQEEIIDPGRPIVDAHHHAWDRPGNRYLVGELAADAGSGHNVLATVYVDCHSMYRATGPEEFRPVGEIEFANGIAAMSASGGYGDTAICAAIVGHADLQLGEKVRAVLEAEIGAGNGRFRGIRHLTAWDADPCVAGVLASRPEGVLLDPAFRKGFEQLAALDLVFDAFVFQTQLGEVADLAQAFPDTRIVLNHCGGPLGVGRFADRREEAFAQWRSSLEVVAECPNIRIKIGGLGTNLLGFGFDRLPVPASSEELAKAWGPYIEVCIEAFGPERCMVESDFPPDKGQCSYHVLFNALKRVTAQYSEDEKNAMFSRTASAVYGLKL